MNPNSSDFASGEQRLPLELLHALAWVHWAAAWANRDVGRLDAAASQAIVLAAESVAAGSHDDELAALAWQPAAGPNSQRHVGALLARLASRASRNAVDAGRVVDASVDVAMSQSEPDSFATAAQVAVALQAKARLLPALAVLRARLAMQALAPGDPVAPSAHFAAYQLRAHAAQLAVCDAGMRHALLAVHTLALGRGAAGDHPLANFDFGTCVVERLAARLALPLSQAVDTPATLPGQAALLALHGSLRLLAIALAGMARQALPPDSPGGCAAEALALVCAQVVGHDAAIGFAAGRGSTHGHGLAPLIVLNTLDSLRLLSDAIHGYSHYGRAEIDHSRPAGPALEANLAWPEPVPPFVNGLHPERPRARPLDAWADAHPRRADT